MSGWLRLALVAWVLWTWRAYVYLDEEFGWYAATRMALVGLSVGPPAVVHWIWRGFTMKTAP